LSYYVLQAYYIIHVKLYYLQYSGDPGPHILSSRAGPAPLQGSSTSILFIFLKYVRFKTSTISSTAEYANVVYVYGFCDGKAIHALAEYQRSFPNRRIANLRIFSEFTRYREIPVRLPTFVLSVSLMKTSVGNKTLFRWYSIIRVLLRKKAARRLDVP